MESSINTMSDKRNIFNEKTFIVWLLIIASSMLFLAFISAYWVQKRDAVLNDAWFFFQLPYQFWMSTGIVLISGVTMQWAYISAKKDDVQRVPSLLTITVLLGVWFFYSQISGFRALMDMGLFFANTRTSEISATYVYVFTGAHLVHIIGGLVLLIVGIVKASRLEIHKKNLGFISVCKTYWHFLGIVWILLILFLYFA